jgi:UDP-GlcNAc3NAcA epimerase
VKVVTILGARPQFIKAWATSAALQAAGCREVLVHTGQHYDESLSGRFFTELDLPRPQHQLGIGSGSHGRQTGQMLEAVERVLEAEAPDWVLVYGDTNSTLAGALAAAKLHRPIAHIEAGLRSFNRRMPEEVNRVVTDHLSELLLCPSQAAVDNLQREGLTHGVHIVGDVMHDALLHFSARARRSSDILDRLGLTAGAYHVATVHRAEVTDNPARLGALLATLGQLNRPVVLPLHPRTRARLAEHSRREFGAALRLIEPLGYLDMLKLVSESDRVLTDSGGLQKEAYWLRKPCVTLRAETEWVETVAAGWNRLVHDDPVAIAAAVQAQPPASHPALYGDGHAAGRIASLLGTHPRR